MEVGKIIKDEGGRWVAVPDKEWSVEAGAGELQDLWSRVLRGLGFSAAGVMVDRSENDWWGGGSG